MSLVRRIARPLLAAPFILEGVRSFRQPARQIDVAPTAFEKADSVLAESSAPGFVDVRTIVRGTAAVTIGAGLLYATNRAPRVAAATLLVTSSVGWAGRKKIWELSGEERIQELQSMLVDAGLLGGMLLAAVDHDGKPSVGYRVNKFVERSQKAAEKKQRQLEKKASAVEKKAKGTAKDVQKKIAAQQA